jgi:hypothetical protein
MKKWGCIGDVLYCAGVVVCWQVFTFWQALAIVLMCVGIAMSEKAGARGEKG